MELNKNQMEGVVARAAERQAEIQQRAAEEARQKALGANEYSGFMAGDSSEKVAMRMEKDKRTIADLSEQIKKTQN